MLEADTKLHYFTRMLIKMYNFSINQVGKKAYFSRLGECQDHYNFITILTSPFLNILKPFLNKQFRNITGK